MQPAGATFELDLARLVSNRPIRGAVNTHFHPDHAFGDSAYAAAKVPIIAQDTAPALIKSRYEALKTADRAALLRPYQERLAAATTEAAIRRAKEDIGAMQWMFSAIDSTELTYPTELLSIDKPATRIDLGGLTAVLECRRGHTPTDVVVRVPEREVLFVGDLLFHREYPVCIDADMLAWRKVLEPMAAEPASVRFVPGHGPICDRGTVREFIDLLDDLHAHAEKMIAAGASSSEAEDRYVVPAPSASTALLVGLADRRRDAQLLRDAEAVIRPSRRDCLRDERVALRRENRVQPVVAGRHARLHARLQRHVAGFLRVVPDSHRHGRLPACVPSSRS